MQRSTEYEKEKKENQQEKKLTFFASENLFVHNFFFLSRTHHRLCIFFLSIK